MESERYVPDREAFLKLAKRGNVVPVYREEIGRAHV